jgi:hypothetical protein
MATLGAHSRELDDRFTLWDQFDDRGKPCAKEVPVERRHNHHFAQPRSMLAKRHQVFKELPLCRIERREVS